MKICRMQEANAFSVFNVEAPISLSDRQKFVMALCERFGLKGSRAWRSFLGNGETTGLLQLAAWHASPAAIAAQTGKAQRQKHGCHDPESPHQRAWLKVWLQLHTKPDSHRDAYSLIGHYLSALSGTGTVERFIGCMGSVKWSGKRSLHDRSLEASIKLLCQDVQGRRRTPLNPEALLCKASAGKTSSGSTVNFPASAYLLKCQQLYGQWFLDKFIPSRSTYISKFGFSHSVGW